MRNTINNADRDEIRGTIMKHAFAERFFALALERQELALRVYDEVVDADRVAEIGAPWVTTAKTRFQIAGDGQVLEFDVSGAVTIRPTTWRHRRSWHFDTPDVARRLRAASRALDESLLGAALGTVIIAAFLVAIPVLLPIIFEVLK